jgi:acetoin utilization protein AcuB
MMNEPLSTIMTKNVHTLTELDSLADAKEMFLKYDIRHIPIVNSNQTMVGILSVYDLMKKENHKEVTIGEVMTKGIAKLLPNDKIGSAAEIFSRHLFHSLPIVDEENHILGIVTPFDVLDYVYRKTYPTSS